MLPTNMPSKSPTQDGTKSKLARRLRRAYNRFGYGPTSDVGLFHDIYYHQSSRAGYLSCVKVQR